LRYLNLGCGHRFHPSWTNVDFISTDNGVIAHNLMEGIPFSDEYFDVVYHSHLLEHFPKDKAEPFMKECLRILSPKGVIRVVIPDLEFLANNYIKTLDEARKGNPRADSNYQWSLLHLFDQTFRSCHGGSMAEYLSRNGIDNEEYIVKHCGIEAKKIIDIFKENHGTNRITNFIKKYYLLLKNPNVFRELLIKTLLGKEYNALLIGRFRKSGEVHQWMYDRYSLKKLLNKCGFVEITECTAIDSRIQDWQSFHLDTDPDGSVYRPDSIFMEAGKATHPA
jgi:predicted SAM-dependent methyltransferase